MKRITITICAAVMLFACNSEEKKAEETKTEDPKVAAAATETKKTEPVPDSVMMKNWEIYATPGKEHQMMASWDGNWTGEVTMWMSPGTPPSTSTSQTTNKMILGGRYQESSHKGSFNGQPFEGRATLAFDNEKKVFISTWIDNMGTGVMKGEGPWDEATKSITIKGKMTEPGNSSDKDFREVFKIVDNDHQIMEMYAPGPDGKEFKTMEIRYTRKK